MSTTGKFELLKDLTHLIRKYGPAVFADLASYLRNPEAISELVAILEALENAGHRAGVTEKPVRPNTTKSAEENVQYLLSRLEKEEPEKAKLLSSFYSSLAAKQALPTLREMKSFAQDNGLRLISAKSREKAIGPLLRDLAMRPLQDIHSLLGYIRIEDSPGDRTLEGWANIILSKRQTHSDS